MVLYIVLFLVVLALCYVLFNFLRIRRMREGTDVMVEMAGIIRSGATAFLETEFKTIAIVVVVLAAIFSLFIEVTSGITFLFGACMSSAVCVLGMRSATYATSAPRTLRAKRALSARPSRSPCVAAAFPDCPCRRSACWAWSLSCSSGASTPAPRATVL